MAGQMIKEMSQLRREKGYVSTRRSLRSGSLSLDGLRQYEKVTTTQQQAVCRVLSVNTNSTYDNEVSRIMGAYLQLLQQNQAHIQLQLHKLYQAHLQQLQLYRK